MNNLKNNVDCKKQITKKYAQNNVIPIHFHTHAQICVCRLYIILKHRLEVYVPVVVSGEERKEMELRKRMQAFYTTSFMFFLKKEKNYNCYTFVNSQWIGTPKFYTIIF